MLCVERHPFPNAARVLSIILYRFNIMNFVIQTFNLGSVSSSEANISNFATTLTNDNSSRNFFTTYQQSVTSNEPIVFSYYVDGLYGNDCIARIAKYVLANNLPVSFADVNCACYGDCQPPRAPNPGAAAWYQASQRDKNNVTSVLTYFQNNAVYIVIIGLVVMLGLVGK